MRPARLILLALATLAAGASSASAAAYQALVVNDLSTANSVTPIDLARNTPGPAFGVGRLPLGIAITPDARRAYVVDVGSVELTPIDLTASPPRPLAAISLADPPAPRRTRTPNDIAISPDGRRAFVTDPANAQLIPLDLTSSRPRVLPAIAVGGTGPGVVFSPDGRTAYVANTSETGTPGLVPITVATGRRGRKITGVGPNPFSLAVTPDGRTLYVTSNSPANGPGVYPVTLATGRVRAPIPVPGQQVQIAVAPDGRTAYAGGDGSVYPIDVATSALGPAIPTGGTLVYALAITPDGRTLYATDGALDGSTVTPIDLTTRTAGPPIAVGSSPRGIAITPDQAPVARLTVTPGATARFDARASTVRYGQIVRYDFDFGDGSPVSSSASPVATHPYARPGLYTATVTATDSAGTSATGGAFTGRTASGTPRGTAAASVTFASGATALAPPVAGKTAVARPVSGTVLVRPRGGERFVSLRAPADIRFGSELDATRGHVALTVASGPARATDVVDVSGGRFVPTQRGGTTTFALSERLRCTRARAFAARRRPPRSRTIRVAERRGRFTTKGQYVSASVEGTTWRTTDRCARSTVSVSGGLVRVRDLVKRKTVTIGAGESYTARKR